MTESIIDAHHHIWRLAATPWLQGPPVPRIFGAYEPLRRDYTIEEYLRDALPCGVTQSVFVQVNVAPGKEVEEVDWVQAVARQHRFPQAITGYADLGSPAIGATLDREAAAENLRAIRQQLHWHKDPRYRFAAVPDLMRQSAWRSGLRAVAQRSLAFELQVFAGQMRDAAALAGDFPNLTFILLHAGMLEDRSEEGWRQWRDGMRRLADCPNVVTKLSGLGTFDRACSVERWRPVIEQTVEFFGPTRCMFGSNFPIESLWTTYADLVNVVKQCIGQYSEAERLAILHDTAARVYRLSP